MEIRSVGTAFEKVEPSSSNFPQQISEFGRNKDTLEGAGSKKESWGAFALRYLLFIPNLILGCIKKVIWVLTGGCFCNEAPTQKTVVELLTPVEKTWNDRDSSETEKKNAWAQFKKKCHGGEEFLRDVYLEGERNADLGPKNQDAEAIETWERDYRESKIREFNGAIENLTGTLLTDCLDRMKS